MMPSKGQLGIFTRTKVITLSKKGTVSHARSEKKFEVQTKTKNGCFQTEEIASCASITNKDHIRR